MYAYHTVLPRIFTDTTFRYCLSTNKNKRQKCVLRRFRHPLTGVYPFNIFNGCRLKRGHNKVLPLKSNIVILFHVLRMQISAASKCLFGGHFSFAWAPSPSLCLCLPVCRFKTTECTKVFQRSVCTCLIMRFLYKLFCKGKQHLTFSNGWLYVCSFLALVFVMIFFSFFYSV